MLSPSAPSPTPAPTPVGITLPAGAATSGAFTPGLRFTVPAGWIKTDDVPELLRISPRDAGFLRQGDGHLYFDAIVAYARPVAGPPDGGSATVAGVGTKARDLATWLSTRRQILASPPQRVTFAGRTAYMLDFGLSPDAGTLCGMPCVNLLNSTDDGASYQFGIEGPSKYRAYLVDAPDGTTIMVTIEDIDGNGMAKELNAAQPILDSMTFSP